MEMRKKGEDLQRESHLQDGVPEKTPVSEPPPLFFSLSSADYTVFTYCIERRDGDKPPLMLIPAATMWKPLPPNVNQTPQLLPFHVLGARLSRGGVVV